MLKRSRSSLSYEVNTKLFKPGFHIVVSDGDVLASTGHDGDASGTLSKVELISTFPVLTRTSAILRVRRRYYKTFPYLRKRPSSIAGSLTGTRPRHFRRCGNQALLIIAWQLFSYVTISPRCCHN